MNEGEDPISDAVCRTAIVTADYVYQNGCFEKLEMKVNGAANVLIGVGIGIAFVEVFRCKNHSMTLLMMHLYTAMLFFQIIGIILACWLASSIKKDEEEK